MRTSRHIAVVVALGWAAAPVAAQKAEPRTLDEAALAARIEEYADTRTGRERAADDGKAKAAAERFTAAFVTRDAKVMLAESSLPWVDRAQLIREEATLKTRLAEFLVPASFAKGDQRITLLIGLAELEQALGRKVPDAARETWSGHLSAGSRIAVVQRGPMLVGLSLRRARDGYRVSGLLFDYFPEPDDPLLRAITKSLLDPR